MSAQPAFDRALNEASVLLRGAEMKVVEVTQISGALPKLQVAVPANYESWDPQAEAPLVAYIPQGVDDLTLKTLTAYDSNGGVHQIDAQVAPSEPVIVVGINERTDANGELREGFGPKGDLLTAAASRLDSPAKQLLEPVTPAMEAAAIGDSYNVRMHSVYLEDAKEPWPLGDAEISFRAKSAGCGSLYYEDNNWAGLNEDYDAWNGNRNLGNTKCDVLFAWWEDDSGDWDFELTIAGYGIGVGMANEDDMIGKKREAHKRYKGNSTNPLKWRPSEWSDLTHWAR